MQRQVKPSFDFVKRHGVGNQLRNRNGATENQVSGDALEVDIGTIRSKHNPLPHADVLAGEFDSLFVGSLCE